MPYLPYMMQKEETTMESYVERWAREQKEAAQKVGAVAAATS